MKLSNAPNNSKEEGSKISIASDTHAIDGKDEMLADPKVDNVSLKDS